MVVQIIRIDANYDSYTNDDYVIAIGNFDGVHKAHESILRMAKKIAKEKGYAFAVMTFDTTPKKLINNIDNYYILRTQEQKFKIFEQIGVECVFLLVFDERLRAVNAADFVQRFIINNRIKYIVCGYDWRFGKDKQGDVEFLRRYNEFETIVLSQEKINNLKIGSTYIHELILNGEIEKANYLLTKPYSIIGTVVHGNKKGRLLGFPTANLNIIANYRLPLSGVYAVKVIIDGFEYLGMTNIGHNPTFNYNNNIRIETNIFDYDGDLYDRIIELVFYKFIRQEKIFESIDLLIRQLKQDKEVIFEYFESLGK